MIGKHTFTETIELITRTGDAYVGGRYVAGTETTSASIRASVQPCSDREIERLPEGERAKERLKVYLDHSVVVQLLQNNVDPTQDSSVVVYRGVRYSVVASKEYPTQRQAHWRLTVVKENP